MPMAGRLYSTKRCASGNTPHRLSTLAIAVNAGEWSFPDAPLRGVYALNNVYERIESWDDFAPWLERIERFSARQLQGIADEIPCEWYGERAQLQRLLNCLLGRGSIVRKLIEDFRTSSRNPFPNWPTTTSPPATND